MSNEEMDFWIKQITNCEHKIKEAEKITSDLLAALKKQAENGKPFLPPNDNDKK